MADPDDLDGHLLDSATTTVGDLVAEVAALRTILRRLRQSGTFTVADDRLTVHAVAALCDDELAALRRL